MSTLDEPIQQYPKMIYHANGESTIIHGKAELSVYLELGWSETPERHSEKEAIKYKIRIMRDELAALETQLEGIEDLPEPVVAKRPPAPTILPDKPTQIPPLAPPAPPLISVNNSLHPPVTKLTPPTPSPPPLKGSRK